MGPVLGRLVSSTLITDVYAHAHTAFTTHAAALRDGRQPLWPVKDQ